MSGPQTPRRKARRRAFQVLYGFSFEAPVSARGMKKAFTDAPSDPAIPDPGGEDYSLSLVEGAWAAREELDAIVQQHSQNWKLTRIAKVEITLLRLALFEMLHAADMPLRVVVNEAVELAKEFGDENSPAFINGILDAVAKAVDQGKFAVKKDLSRGKEEA